MEGNNINGNAPTDKQLDMIGKLAKKTRSSVDLNKVTTKQEASELIKELIAKQNGNGSSRNDSHNSDSKSNKIAYGLAVKLVSARYQQLSMDTKTDDFWKDVDEFYQQYLEHQDRATKPGSQR